MRASLLPVEARNDAVQLLHQPYRFGHHSDRLGHPVTGMAARHILHARQADRLSVEQEPVPFDRKFTESETGFIAVLQPFRAVYIDPHHIEVRRVEMPQADLFEDHSGRKDTVLRLQRHTLLRNGFAVFPVQNGQCEIGPANPLVPEPDLHGGDRRTVGQVDIGPYVGIAHGDARPLRRARPGG